MCDTSTLPSALGARKRLTYVVPVNVKSETSESALNTLAVLPSPHLPVSHLRHGSNPPPAPRPTPSMHGIIAAVSCVALDLEASRNMPTHVTADVLMAVGCNDSSSACGGVDVFLKPEQKHNFETPTPPLLRSLAPAVSLSRNLAGTNNLEGEILGVVTGCSLTSVLLPASFFAPYSCPALLRTPGGDDALAGAGTQASPMLTRAGSLWSAARALG